MHGHTYIKLMQIHCFFKKTIRKLWGARNMLKNTRPLRNNAEGYGCNSQHTDQMTVTSQNLVAEGSITYHSWSSKWVQTILGTHSYVGVFRQSHHSQTNAH